MKRTFQSAKLKFGILAVTIVSLLSVAQPASAARLSYVWNDFTTKVAVYSAPSTASIPHHYAKNGTKFAMRCWIDNQNRRWFLGTIYDTGSYVYVEARLVGSQTTVGRC